MRFFQFTFSLLIMLPALSQNFERIHRKAIFIDSHNDILTQNLEKGVIIDTDLTGKTHSDLNRWKRGGLDAQIFSVWCDGEKKNPYNYAKQQLDTLAALIRRNPGKIVMVSDSEQLLRVVRKRKIAALAGVEGGHMIEDDLAKLDTLYARGVRYMTLTWNNSTSWATSAFDEVFKKNLASKGLNNFGRQVVQHMNKIGMIVDISHVGEQTFNDVLSVTTKPIFASHSSVYALCPHQRNLKDDQIKAIAKNGGVIQINFFSGFLDSNFTKNTAAFLGAHKVEYDSLKNSGAPDHVADEYMTVKYKHEAEAIRAPFELVIAHIDYIVKLVGIDYVGIGSDFDGISSSPNGLDDVTAYPQITRALLAKGYSRKDINKVLGGNFLRVLKANEATQQ